MKKILLFACLFAFGTIAMAQTTDAQKSTDAKKEMMSKPQKKNMKKVDVNVIEKTESSTSKEEAAETPEIQKSEENKQVKKSEATKQPATETKKAGKSEPADKKQKRDE